MEAIHLDVLEYPAAANAGRAARASEKTLSMVNIWLCVSKDGVTEEV